jgi:hypothetical protein
MRILFFILFLFYFNASFSQDISGTWIGNYGGAILMMKPQKLVAEIFLSNDSIITGATHLYYRNNQYEHYTIIGKYNKKDSTIIFTEDSTIAVKLGFLATNCLGRYKMKLAVSDTAYRFEGRWKDKSTSIFKCPSSSVWLSKKRDIKKDTATKTTETVEKIVNRATDIQSLIEIKKQDADSIKVEIYDNGEIDNDTISVYHNDLLVVDRKMISIKPITIYISLTDEDPISKLKLIAESVGSIPPCTALMIITTKKKRYEVNLKSDFYKNGVVEFFLKE